MSEIARIRAAHKSARPNPVENPAFANTYRDLDYVLKYIDNQVLPYLKECIRFGRPGARLYMAREMIEEITGEQATETPP